MIEKKKEKDAILKQLEKEDKAVKTIERRQKSAEEIELEDYMKQNRKEQIHRRVEIEREKRSHAKNIFQDVHPLNTRNVFSGASINQPNIFSGF